MDPNEETVILQHPARRVVNPLSCPRCDSGQSLTNRGDFYGDYLACLVCGWNGEADESGAPVMVVIPPPPIKRRRRRKRLPDGRLVDPADTSIE